MTFKTTMTILSKNMIHLPIFSGLESISPKLKRELHLKYNQDISKTFNTRNYETLWN